MMFDKRVVRGNTYAQMVIPASTQQEMERQQEMEQKRELRSQQRREAENEQMQREISTPEPVENRKHIDVQTENYIEELTDKPPEYEIETQTEFNIDRPPTPLFIPQKLGEDAETQVEDGELFCFNEEVDPILRVLCGKTLELSRMEVLEEEELREMRHHQREFEQKRDAELIEVQRLEQEERERKEEADKRKKQMIERRQQRKFAHQKFCCRIYSKRYLSKLRKGSLSVMRDLGTFRPPQELAFHDQLVPWLTTGVLDRLTIRREQDDSLSSVLAQSTQSITAQHAAAVKAEADRKAAIQREKERVEQETAARKQHRVEMREKRAAWRERMALEAKIQSGLIDVGRKVEGIVNAELSDFDEITTTPIAGTVGGTIMELCVLLACAEEILTEPLTDDQVTQIIQFFANQFVKPDSFLTLNTVTRERWTEFLTNEIRGELEEPVDAEAAPEVKTDSFHDLPEDQWASLVEFLGNPENHSQGAPLAIVWQNVEEFHVRAELVRAIVTSIAGTLRLKEEDEAFPAKERVRFALIEPPGETTVTRCALVKICVPLNREVVQHEEEEEQDLSGEAAQEGDTVEPAAVEVQPQEGAPEEPTDELDEDEQVPPEPLKPYLAPPPSDNFPEIEYEDHAHLIPTQSLDLTVYTLNQLTQRTIRREMVATLKSMKEFEHLNAEILNDRVAEVASHIEEEVVRQVVGDLPVFKFEVN